MTPRATGPWPVEIRLKRDPSALEIDFESGERIRLEAEYLRIESPSAEVKGHGGAVPPPVAGKRQVRIGAVEPVGHYALRLIFDDGHSTGLYSWALLHELGREREARWAAYLKRLDEHGLSRDPPQGRG
jgi:DUF971 family protein